MFEVHQVNSFFDNHVKFIFLIVCWSPKGKQIVVVTKDGALELYDQNKI